MNDEIKNDETGEITVKRKRGWQKGRPRRAKRSSRPDWDNGAKAAEAPSKSPLLKMKARPNWENDDFGRDAVMVDRLNIPQEKIDALYRDGIALEWATKSVRGMETPKQLSASARGGWTPVHQSDFDGALDGMFLPKGIDEVITVDDCMLVARPAEIHEKAKLQDRRDANALVKMAERMVDEGIPRISGASHRSVKNHITKTMERIEIPEE